jgi:divalent metal cation (Fe/Co/Zn/Cd) transporter
MDNNKTRQQRTRSDMAFYVAIVGGLLLGILIKKVRVGLLLGLVLAALIVFTGWVKTKRSR